MNIELGEVYNNLPSSLLTFELICGDEQFTEGGFDQLLKSLTLNCPSLTHLTLSNLLNLDLAHSRYLPYFLDLLSSRLTTLQTLNLSRTQASPYLTRSLADFLLKTTKQPALRTLILKHLRGKIDWEELLGPIVRSGREIEVLVSEGQIRSSQGYKRVVEEAKTGGIARVRAE